MIAMPSPAAIARGRARYLELRAAAGQPVQVRDDAAYTKALAADNSARDEMVADLLATAGPVSAEKIKLGREHYLRLRAEDKLAQTKGAPAPAIGGFRVRNIVRDPNGDIAGCDLIPI
jgi:hypothetical protein